MTKLNLMITNLKSLSILLGANEMNLLALRKPQKIKVLKIKIPDDIFSFRFAWNFYNAYQGSLVNIG